MRDSSLWHFLSFNLYFCVNSLQKWMNEVDFTLIPLPFPTPTNRTRSMRLFSRKSNKVAFIKIICHFDILALKLIVVSFAQFIVFIKMPSDNNICHAWKGYGKCPPLCWFMAMTHCSIPRAYFLLDNWPLNVYARWLFMQLEGLQYVFGFSLVFCSFYWNIILSRDKGHLYSSLDSIY